MRPALLLFDLDGTVLDSVPMIVDSLRWTVSTELGLDLDDDTLRAGVGTSLKAQLTAHALRAGEDPTDERVMALVWSYLEHNHATHDERIKLYPGMLDTLDALASRGHRMGIVTSKARQISLRGLTVTRAARCFEHLIGYEDTLKHKPEPEPLYLALERFGYEAAEAVYIGDSPFDMLAGRAAGLRTIAAGWGPFPRAELEATEPDHLLESHADLLRLAL